MSKTIHLIIIIILAVSTLTFCSAKFTQKKVESEKLLEKIELMELIYKNELNQLLGTNLFKKYNDKFIGVAGVKVSNNLCAGVIEGIRNDTIFNISFISRDNNLLMLKEFPKSTFYYKDEAIIEEYIIGRTYTTMINDSCIAVNFEKIHPIKIDTMKNKFSYRQCKIENHDFFQACNASNTYKFNLEK